MRDAPQVSTRRAVHAQLRLAAFHAQQIQRENLNAYRSQLDGLLFAGQLIRRPAADLFRRHWRWRLVEASAKAVQNTLELGPIERDGPLFGDALALGIVAAGGVAELDGAFVNFVVARIK